MVLLVKKDAQIGPTHTYILHIDICEKTTSFPVELYYFLVAKLQRILTFSMELLLFGCQVSKFQSYREFTGPHVFYQFINDNI